MKKILITLVILLIIVLVGLQIFFAVTPMGKALWNRWFFKVQKADDNTNYETIKKVEDTCRSMITSYESDKLKYEQYIKSDDKVKLEWAEQAKMRVNNTASKYNNYILKNSFIWEGNVPSDIKAELDYLE